MTKLALDGTLLGTFPTGKLPYAAAFDGSNIWVLNTEEETVTKF